MPEQSAPLCMKCGNPTKLFQAIDPVGRSRVKAMCCGMWSWNNKPLVDRRTHGARIEAHRAFDRLWKNKMVTRKEAYRRLAILMVMTNEQCHIAAMDWRTAQRVVEIVRTGRIVNWEGDHGAV